MNMKKIIIVAILIFSTVSNLWAIDEKYTRGYVMLPSVVNTTNDETAMSFFKNKVVYSLIDERGNIKIYGAVINDSIIELKEPEEMKEMQDLGIYGTFGFDEKTNKIYFSRYDKKTKNYMLYRSVLTGENTWSKPKKLKIQGLRGFINTGSATVNAGWLYRNPGFSGFFNPTLAQNGSRIYFSADFSTGKGERDIWYIDAAKGNKWSMPQNMGEVANSVAREDYPFASGDSLLYFASKKAHGDFDLYVSKKENGEWQPAVALAPMYNSLADDYNLIGTDNVLFFISGRNESKGDDIYRPQRISIGEMQAFIEPRPVPEAAPGFRTFPWKLFYFDFDKDVLKQEFIDELDELYVTMQDYVLDFDFVIRGHTDERGSEAYNQRLSYRRAQRIYRLLIERGMPAHKMKIEAYGKSEPVIRDAGTEEEHAQNRRVEVDIVKPPQEEVETSIEIKDDTDVVVTNEE